MILSYPSTQMFMTRIIYAFILQANLLCLSVYIHLAGYEDVKDAQRLSVGPVMIAVTEPLFFP
jgi:uncharacterized membrane protein